jgi:hypothetical protein
MALRRAQASSPVPLLVQILRLEVRWELLGEGLAGKTLTITGLRVLTRSSARWSVRAAQDTIARPLPAR